MRRLVRAGPLVFRDPLLLCGALYLLLWSDASGFLRTGLLAAFLHEWGHILVYCAQQRRFPVIEVTLTGFCMRLGRAELSPAQRFRLAAAGPAVLAAARPAQRCAGTCRPARAYIGYTCNRLPSRVFLVPTAQCCTGKTRDSRCLHRAVHFFPSLGL